MVSQKVMQLQASGKLRCVIFEMMFFLFARAQVGRGGEKKNIGRIADPAFEFEGQNRTLISIDF